VRGKGLDQFHRCGIEALGPGGSAPLTAVQWRILISCLEHNLNNGINPLHTILFFLERGEPYPNAAGQIQAVCDRVQALLATLRELEQQQVQSSALDDGVKGPGG
jgi:hypothetical protein